MCHFSCLGMAIVLTDQLKHQVRAAISSLKYFRGLPKLPGTFSAPLSRSLDMFDFLHYTFGFQVSWQLMLVLDSCLSSLCFSLCWIELHFNFYREILWCVFWLCSIKKTASWGWVLHENLVLWFFPPLTSLIHTLLSCMENGIVGVAKDWSFSAS